MDFIELKFMLKLDGRINLQECSMSLFALYRMKTGKEIRQTKSVFLLASSSSFRNSAVRNVALSSKTSRLYELGWNIFGYCVC